MDPSCVLEQKDNPHICENFCEHIQHSIKQMKIANGVDKEERNDLGMQLNLPSKYKSFSVIIVLIWNSNTGGD